ncbi:MAG TPA: hydrogenase, partial [Vicinamibacteria bacterium]
MEVSGASKRHGHRLLQVGMLLFLLALFVGLAVPKFALPRLALSTHLLGILQGTFLLVVGSLWPRLRLTSSLSMAGCALAVYGCIAAWTANLCGALWGAGGAMVPLAAGQARGSAIQEGLIRFGLMTA